MQNPGNQNSASDLPIKYDMTPTLHPAQTRPDVIAFPTEPRIVCEHLAERLEIIKITDYLRFTPGPQSKVGDFV